METKEYLEFVQIVNADGEVLRVESLRGIFPKDKDVLTRVISFSDHETIVRELTKQRDELRSALGEAYQTINACIENPANLTPEQENIGNRAILILGRNKLTALLKGDG